MKRMGWAASVPPEEVRASVEGAYEAIAERRELGIGAARAAERLLGLAGYRQSVLDSAPPALLHLASGCGDPLAVCPPSPGERVLDVGSGGGLDLYLAARAVGPSGRVLGVDLCEPVNVLARGHLAEAGVEGVEIRRGLAEALPVAEGSIDLVVVNALLCLSPEKPKALAELARVLAPGGWLALSEPVVEALPPWASISRGLWWAGVAGAYEAGALFEALAAAGFESLEVHREERLAEAELEDLIDGGQAGLEVAGCSASGAILGSEAASALVGAVSAVTLTARRARG